MDQYLAKIQLLYIIKIYSDKVTKISFRSLHSKRIQKNKDKLSSS